VTRLTRDVLKKIFADSDSADDEESDSDVESDSESDAVDDRAVESEQAS